MRALLRVVGVGVRFVLRCFFAAAAYPSTSVAFSGTAVVLLVGAASVSLAVSLSLCRSFRRAPMFILSRLWCLCRRR